MKESTLIHIRSMSDAQLAEIALKFAISHSKAFVKYAGINLITFKVPFVGTTASFTAEQLSELRCYGADRRVTCIKRIRDFTGLGLKEAKDLSDAEFVKVTP